MKIKLCLFKLCKLDADTNILILCICCHQSSMTSPMSAVNSCWWLSYRGHLIVSKWYHHCNQTIKASGKESANPLWICLMWILSPMPSAVWFEDEVICLETLLQYVQWTIKLCNELSNKANLFNSNNQYYAPGFDSMFWLRFWSQRLIILHRFF